MTQPSRILYGRRAIVTGASSGIGAATAIRLASSGAAVVAVGRRTPELSALVSRITDAGGSAIAVAADITRASDRIRVRDSALETLGGIDLLVNNAGMMRLSSVTDLESAQLQAMIDLNVTATFALTSELLNDLISADARPADIVMMSSLSARDPLPGRSVYAATKAGIGAFSEALRRETAAVGVRVSVIEPGLVETELRDGIDSSVIRAFQTGYDPAQPLTPADIAETVCFITSQPANVAISSIVVRPSGQVG